MSLAGKTALITGAAGGIGSAVAVELAKHGVNLGLADIHDLTRIKQTVTAYGARVGAYQVDLTSLPSILQWVEASEQDFGNFDILVTAAGVVGYGGAGSITEAEWDRIININMKGAFFCCQAVFPHMKKNRSGRIINIGSVLAKNGGNPRPWIQPAEQDKASSIVYGMSKAGVHAMTLYLAKELASFGITVNAVAPGPVASDMTREFPESLKQLIPMQRMGTADEVATAVRFLAEDSTGFITGEILDVNGGLWTD